MPEDIKTRDPREVSLRFLRDSLKPTLVQLVMWSAAAEKIMLMIAAHESAGFRYRRQVGGPALSYFQIEPATLDDLYESYLKYRPGRQALLDRYLPADMDRYEALEKIDAYACAAARLLLIRVKDPFPDIADEMALAGYCKRHWNTEEGKATPEKYLNDFNRYKPEGYEL